MAVPGIPGKSIHIAAMDGDVSAVQRWLDAGNFVDKRDGAERTGLHQASWSGRIEVVSLLLGAYADVNAQDKQQRTPLHLCSELGHQAVVEVLVEFKADLNAVDLQRETALSKAARAGMIDVVEFLLGAGAEIEVPDADNNVGEAFYSKVPPENREKIISMRNARQQMLATAKARSEAVRLSKRAEADAISGSRESKGKEGSGCARCSVS